MFGIRKVRKYKSPKKSGRIISRNQRVILVETEHEDGNVEKNLTTLDLFEKEWGEEYRDYVGEYGDQERTLTKQVKKNGMAWFDTKYRTITVHQITNPEEIRKMLDGEYDDPEFVCRANGTDAEFTWRPDLVPEEARERIGKLCIPEHLYSQNRR